MQALPVSFLEEIAEYCGFTYKQREAFVAFYRSGSSKEQIAYELGISMSAILSHNSSNFKTTS